METRKLTKEDLGEKVIFPRSQMKGLTCNEQDEKPAITDFRYRLVPGPSEVGLVRLIEQTAEPHMTFHIMFPGGAEQFDDYLGTLLGMHDVPSWIEGRTDFMVLFAGSKEHQEVNQKNHKEVYQQICRMQELATRWWHLYGNSPEILNKL